MMHTIAWGVYPGHFVGLVFGDTTFLMNSIEFLTLFNNDIFLITY